MSLVPFSAAVGPCQACGGCPRFFVSLEDLSKNPHVAIFFFTCALPNAASPATAPPPVPPPATPAIPALAGHLPSKPTHGQSIGTDVRLRNAANAVMPNITPGPSSAGPPAPATHPVIHSLPAETYPSQPPPPPPALARHATMSSLLNARAAANPGSVAVPRKGSRSKKANTATPQSRQAKPPKPIEWGSRMRPDEPFLTHVVLADSPRAVWEGTYRVPSYARLVVMEQERLLFRMVVNPDMTAHQFNDRLAREFAHIAEIANNGDSVFAADWVVLRLATDSQTGPMAPSLQPPQVTAQGLYNHCLRNPRLFSYKRLIVISGPVDGEETKLPGFERPTDADEPGISAVDEPEPTDTKPQTRRHAKERDAQPTKAHSKGSTRKQSKKKGKGKAKSSLSFVVDSSSELGEDSEDEESASSSASSCPSGDLSMVKEEPGRLTPEASNAGPLATIPVSTESKPEQRRPPPRPVLRKREPRISANASSQSVGLQSGSASQPITLSDDDEPTRIPASRPDAGSRDSHGAQQAADPPKTVKTEPMADQVANLQSLSAMTAMHAARAERRDAAYIAHLRSQDREAPAILLVTEGELLQSRTQTQITRVASEDGVEALSRAVRFMTEHVRRQPFFPGSWTVHWEAIAWRIAEMRALARYVHVEMSMDGYRHLLAGMNTFIEAWPELARAGSMAPWDPNYRVLQERWAVFGRHGITLLSECLDSVRLALLNCPRLWPMHGGCVRMLEEVIAPFAESVLSVVNTFRLRTPRWTWDPAPWARLQYYTELGAVDMPGPSIPLSVNAVTRDLRPDVILEAMVRDFGHATDPAQIHRSQLRWRLRDLRRFLDAELEWLLSLGDPRFERQAAARAIWDRWADVLGETLADMRVRAPPNDLGEFETAAAEFEYDIRNHRMGQVTWDETGAAGEVEGEGEDGPGAGDEDEDDVQDEEEDQDQAEEEDQDDGEGGGEGDVMLESESEVPETRASSVTPSVSGSGRNERSEKSKGKRRQDSTEADSHPNTRSRSVRAVEWRQDALASLLQRSVIDRTWIRDLITQFPHPSGRHNMSATYWLGRNYPQVWSELWKLPREVVPAEEIEVAGVSCVMAGGHSAELPFEREAKCSYLRDNRQKVDLPTQSYPCARSQFELGRKGCRNGGLYGTASSVPVMTDTVMLRVLMCWDLWLSIEQAMAWGAQTRIVRPRGMARGYEGLHPLEVSTEETCSAFADVRGSSVSGPLDPSKSQPRRLVRRMPYPLALRSQLSSLCNGLRCHLRHPPTIRPHRIIAIVMSLQSAPHPGHQETQQPVDIRGLLHAPINCPHLTAVSPIDTFLPISDLDQRSLTSLRDSLKSHLQMLGADASENFDTFASAEVGQKLGSRVKFALLRPLLQHMEEVLTGLDLNPETFPGADETREVDSTVYEGWHVPAQKMREGFPGKKPRPLWLDRLDWYTDLQAAVMPMNPTPPPVTDEDGRIIAGIVRLAASLDKGVEVVDSLCQVALGIRWCMRDSPEGRNEFMGLSRRYVPALDASTTGCSSGLGSNHSAEIRKRRTTRTPAPAHGEIRFIHRVRRGVQLINYAQEILVPDFRPSFLQAQMDLRLWKAIFSLVIDSGRFPEHWFALQRWMSSLPAEVLQSNLGVPGTISYALASSQQLTDANAGSQLMSFRPAGGPSASIVAVRGSAPPTPKAVDTALNGSDDEFAEARPHSTRVGSPEQGEAPPQPPPQDIRPPAEIPPRSEIAPSSPPNLTGILPIETEGYQSTSPRAEKGISPELGSNVGDSSSQPVPRLEQEQPPSPPASNEMSGVHDHVTEGGISALLSTEGRLQMIEKEASGGATPFRSDSPLTPPPPESLTLSPEWRADGAMRLDSEVDHMIAQSLGEQQPLTIAGMSVVGDLGGPTLDIDYSDEEPAQGYVPRKTPLPERLGEEWDDEEEEEGEQERDAEESQEDVSGEEGSDAAAAEPAEVEASGHEPMANGRQGTKRQRAGSQESPPKKKPRNRKQTAVGGEVGVPARPRLVPFETVVPSLEVEGLEEVQPAPARVEGGVAHTPHFT
ncbi:hypothetical protein SISNIDRAFT_463998 [Sistotremastrum niveocremeum HHB9708]|uniref:Uncharacterized protein n=1 Tax=Sistotremastrum niveocremeum HHB9708 TaxID=1314777 RepID=A0A164Y2W9_9AGAM|nr:hypothetical protein SISNIDRAFT_463998 [Sistotremastrum niveocremeum HHB9708]